MKKLAPYTELVSRRRALGLFGATATLLGCGGGSGSEATTSTSTSTATPSTGGSVSCVLTPEETAGPYPLFNDIASCVDVHAGRHHRRKNRRAVAVAADVRQRQLELRADHGCAGLHLALRQGRCVLGYNQPGNNTVGQTFCRGVQMTDSTGLARFTTIYPGWYSGRITHAHFRVYLGNSLEATSQLAFPLEITRAVYGSSLYVGRGQNTSVTSFGADNVFSDGEQYQLVHDDRECVDRRVRFGADRRDQPVAKKRSSRVGSAS